MILDSVLLTASLFLSNVTMVSIKGRNFALFRYGSHLFRNEFTGHKRVLFLHYNP